MKNARRSSRDKTSIKIPTKDIRDYRERDYKGDHIPGFADFKVGAESRFQRKYMETKVINQNDLITILKGKSR